MQMPNIPGMLEKAVEFQPAIFIVNPDLVLLLLLKTDQDRGARTSWRLSTIMEPQGKNDIRSG
jgi:hypothetical protein